MEAWLGALLADDVDARVVESLRAHDDGGLCAAAGQHDFILAARWPFAFARRAIPLQGNRVTADRLLKTHSTFGAALDARFGNVKGNGCFGHQAIERKAPVRLPLERRKNPRARWVEF